MRPFTTIRSATTTFFFLVLSVAFPATLSDAVASSEYYSDEQQPFVPGNFTSITTLPNTVPAFPVAQASNRSTTCHLDLSDELFGGVGDACARGSLDRSRCCPVLAAWLFAAHARSALEVRASAVAAAEEDDGLPMMPDDNQKCVDSLQSALERRDIHLPRPNDTCDLVLCFCGIRLHEIGSLRCPAAFNLSVPATSGVAGGNATAAPRNATPTAAVRHLEHECRNASYAGCSRCLHSLEKLKTRNGGGGVGSGGTGGDRATRMFSRDCQLMGLTWLLEKNKTAYIPTVSAVLRAILYSTYPVTGDGSSSYRCSPDQENMPLAVDSLQFQHLGDQESSAHHFTWGNGLKLLSFALSILLNLLLLPCFVWGDL